MSCTFSILFLALLRTTVVLILHVTYDPRYIFRNAKPILLLLYIHLIWCLPILSYSILHLYILYDLLLLLPFSQALFLSYTYYCSILSFLLRSCIVGMLVLLILPIRFFWNYSLSCWSTLVCSWVSTSSCVLQVLSIHLCCLSLHVLDSACSFWFYFSSFVLSCTLFWMLLLLLQFICLPFLSHSPIRISVLFCSFLEIYYPFVLLYTPYFEPYFKCCFSKAYFF